MDSLLSNGGQLGSSMSSSDISYSSGASGTASTRETSPDSLGPSPFDATLSSPIERYPNTVAAVDGMDRNSFQSVNERRARGIYDRHQAQHQLRSGVTSLPSAHLTRPRSSGGNSSSITSANWRAHHHQPTFSSSSSVLDNSLSFAHASTSTSTGFGSGTMASPTSTSPQQANSYVPYTSLGGTDNFLAANAPQQMIEHASSMDDINMNDNNVYAYCFDRGNGQYTRLIPADMLPALKDIPALQQGHNGMIVLDMPSAFAPNGRSSNSQAVELESPYHSPSPPLQPDPIQRHIDTIVASSPPPATPAPKKVKVYCDKWVHEGVCAFTQQGCKYKHEMPHDKATQVSLGLFHGYPSWYKKHQAELTRQRDIDAGPDQPVVLSSAERRFGASSSGPRFGGTWRRMESSHAPAPAPSPTPAMPGTGRLVHSIHARGQQSMNTPSSGGFGSGPTIAQFTMGSTRQRREGRDYGPIGPPARKATSEPSGGAPSAIVSENPFSKLAIVDDNLDTLDEAIEEDKDDGAGAKLTER